jgi:hypothetical protein
MTTTEASVEHAQLVQLEIVAAVYSNTCYSLLLELKQIRHKRLEYLNKILQSID